MMFVGSTWKMHRLIVAIIALMMLTISVGMHPSSSEASTATSWEASHSHGDNAGNDELPHKGVHHDHHPEIMPELAIIFRALVPSRYERYDQEEDGWIAVELDRPPDLRSVLTR